MCQHINDPPYQNTGKVTGMPWGTTSAMALDARPKGNTFLNWVLLIRPSSWDDAKLLSRFYLVWLRSH